MTNFYSPSTCNPKSLISGSRAPDLDISIVHSLMTKFPTSMRSNSIFVYTPIRLHGILNDSGRGCRPVDYCTATTTTQPLASADPVRAAKLSRREEWCLVQQAVRTAKFAEARDDQTIPNLKLDLVRSRSLPILCTGIVVSGMRSEAKLQRF